jgi:hypothetical protein
MTNWVCTHIGFEADEIRIGGLEVWKHKWRNTGDNIQLPHPQHQHQIHTYRVYEMGDCGTVVRFAATELSVGVWGFYVPESAR